MSEKLPHSNPFDSFYTSRDWSQHGADPGVLSRVVKVAFLGVVPHVGQLSAHASAPVHVVPDFLVQDPGLGAPQVSGPYNIRGGEIARTSRTLSVRKK